MILCFARYRSIVFTARRSPWESPIATTLPLISDGYIVLLPSESLRSFFPEVYQELVVAALQRHVGGVRNIGCRFRASLNSPSSSIPMETRLDTPRQSRTPCFLAY